MRQKGHAGGRRENGNQVYRMTMGMDETLTCKRKLLGSKGPRKAPGPLKKVFQEKKEVEFKHTKWRGLISGRNVP